MSGRREGTMALKNIFLGMLLATTLMLCYTSAQGPSTPANNGCQNMTCPDNQVCKLIQVQCFAAPCYPVPSCVDPPASCAPDPCVGLMCLYGRSTDDNGCIVCGCYEPCYGITCPDGNSCEPTKVSTGYVGDCVATVSRPQCTVYKCATQCRFGYKTDSNGCQMMCQCYDPCERYDCPANTHCMMTADDCTPGEECRDSPMPYCADTSDQSTTQVSSLNKNAPGCGPEPCVGMICLHGKARDSNGCIICDCSNPCWEFDCPEGQECQPTKSSSTGTYVGQCVVTVTRAPCATVTCGSVKCPYGLQSDSNGCPTCDCRDPCQAYHCPENQHCVMSADDCPPGDECRDAPMPYCVGKDYPGIGGQHLNSVSIKLAQLTSQVIPMLLIIWLRYL